MRKMYAQFNYHKKNDPDYNPYGEVFTKRQMDIILGNPVDKLRKGELTVIIKKAEKLGMPSIAEDVMSKYDELFVDVDKFDYKYTYEEAIQRMRDLAVWDD